MLRRFRRASFRSLAVGVLVLAPLVPLALLCRGRSPSRFDTVNLPAWERHVPAPAPARALYALPPGPPGTVQIPRNPWIAGLLQSPDPKDPGAWLEAACVWGQSDPALAARQDRLATRLLATQNDAGWLGGGDPDRPLSPALWAAQRTGLRGLLAWYALTRRPAAIYAALTLGDRALPRLAARPDPAWAEPLARLYLQTGDPRFLRAARRLASPQDGLAQCVLYQASGEGSDLNAAERAFSASAPSPPLAAELLLLTARPSYVRALAALPPFGPVLARIGWTRAPRGIAVHTAQPSSAVFNHVRLTQAAGAAGTRTITVAVPRPTAFKLYVFLPPGPPARVLVNGLPQNAPAPPGGYTVLVRRWRDGDVVILTHSKAARPPDPRIAPRIGVPGRVLMSLPATRPGTAAARR